MMRLKATIEGSLKGIVRDVDRQIRFATAVALTRTAKHVQANQKALMQRVFDRPTPFALGAIAIRPATKDNLEARVFLREFAGKGTPATKYLSAEIFGGPRRRKRFERSLEHARLLPAGMYTVPGAAAEIDRYGNMKRGQIVKILSALRASSDPMQNANASRRSRGRRRNERYFVGGGSRAPHLPPGIYKRLPRGIAPVVIYVRAPHYQPRFDFYGEADRTIQSEFVKEFDKAFAMALGTAR